MRLIVSAVGRLKDGPERALLERYQDRLAPLAKRLGLAPVSWHETGESRAQDAARRREEEGAALLRPMREADFLIALDVRGKALEQRGHRPACWPRSATPAPGPRASSSAARTA